MSKDEITPAQLGIRVGQFKRSKYGSRRTWVEELQRFFDSAHEAEVAVGLVRRQRAGEIEGLLFQVPFDLEVGGETVCRFVADFVWLEPSAVHAGWMRQVVGDAKGYRTPVYKLKAKLMKACLGIAIVEL